MNKLRCTASSGRNPDRSISSALPPLFVIDCVVGLCDRCLRFIMFLLYI